MSELDDVQVLSFDCYGTLIDWEAGILEFMRHWLESHGRQVDDGQVLSLHAQYESQLQRMHPLLPYEQLLSLVLDRIGAALEVPVSVQERQAYGMSVTRWPAFEDSAEALAALGERFDLVILSNVSRASFYWSATNLDTRFTHVITAEDAGSYKPAPAHFEALDSWLAARDMSARNLLHVAQSLFHDHQPAARHGLRSAWIDRRHATEGWGATPAADASAAPELRFTSMREFADFALGR